MPQKIFLSHNHADKPLVEPVAMRLRDIFGQEEVFYDDWSIQPGDSIIEKMSQGLEAPEFVFFFVSAASLRSGMVRLEWQNALYEASQGRTRVVPVRMDESQMPAVLRQTLFIDMHTVGLEAALAQIVNVVQGNGSFTPQHGGFSNLTHTRTNKDEGAIEVTIRASHLMEPNPHFAFVVFNSADDISWWIAGQPAIIDRFLPQAFRLDDGRTVSAVTMRPVSASLTPAFPLTFTFSPARGRSVELGPVLHERGENNWFPVPAQGAPMG